MVTPIEALTVLMPLLIIILNLGLGASISFGDIQQAAGRWKGLLIAVLCQFGIMPAAAFSMAMALGVTNLEGLSMVIIGSCPGGALSNLYAYYSGSDLPLSILATVSSTLVGTVAMPIIVSLYSPPFTDQTTGIPLASMLIPIIMVSIAVTIGMSVNRCNKPLAQKFEKAGSVVGAAFMAVATFTGLLEVLGTTPSWKIWVSAIALMPVGGFLGFWISRFAGLPRKSAQTICFETGLQNAAVGMTVVTLAFPELDRFREAIVFPLVFMLFNNIIGPLMVLLFRFTAPQEEAELVAKEGLGASVELPAQSSV